MKKTNTDLQLKTDSELTAELMALYVINHLMGWITMEDLQRICDIDDEIRNHRTDIDIQEIFLWHKAEDKHYWGKSND